MAGVSVSSGGSGGRKSVDSAINMVPMIDLLISVIAFLLMTAVWIHTGALASQQPRGPSDPVAPTTEHLKIAISPTGFHVGVTEADSRDVAAGEARLDRLRQMLLEWRRDHAQERDVTIQPDSRVSYSEIIAVMDVVYDVWSRGRSPRDAMRDAVRVQLM